MGFSEEALESMPFFYDEYNDIDIYVEDEGYENFYEALINKLLKSENIKVNKIFPCGGKPKVEHFYHVHKESNSRKNFFIMDSDFDRIFSNLIDDTNVYYMPEYCIENHLLEEKAITELILEESPKLPRKIISEKLDYQNWLNEQIEVLKNLFICFMVIQTNKLPEANVAIGPSQFFDDKNKRLCHCKINDFIEGIIVTYYNHDIDEYNVEANKIKELINYSEIDKKTFISGKYFIFALYFHMRSVVSFNINHDSLLYRLLKLCELSSLDELPKKIIEYMS